MFSKFLLVYMCYLSYLFLQKLKNILNVFLLPLHYYSDIVCNLLYSCVTNILFKTFVVNRINVMHYVYFIFMLYTLFVNITKLN